MGGYTMGDIERALGVKDYVIRYWEKEIPMLAPRKGKSGRREYGERDLALLLRARHLIHERHFTIEGARDALMAELSGRGQDLRARVTELRGHLAGLYLLARKNRSPD